MVFTTSGTFDTGTCTRIRERPVHGTYCNTFQYLVNDLFLKKKNKIKYNSTAVCLVLERGPHSEGNCDRAHVLCLPLFYMCSTV